MPALLVRRAPRALTAGIASCALALAAAAPGMARPVGHAGQHACDGCAASIAVRGAHERPTAGIRTSSLAGTTSTSPEVLAAVPSKRSRSLDGGGLADGRGATTLAVILIAAGVMLAGLSVGFAGGRRTTLRIH
jgi:hypothetical protein